MNESWIGTPFKDIDSGLIAKEADKYFAIAMRLEKNLDPNKIQETLKEMVKKFKEAMPIVKALSNQHMQEKHRDEVKELVQKDFDVDHEDFTLKSLLDLDIGEFQEEIVAISTQATQEAKLNKELEEIKQKWTTVDFVIVADENAEDEDFEEEAVAAPDNCFFLVGGMTSRMRTPSAKVSMRAGAVALVAVKGASMPLSSAVDASCEASCLRFFSLSRPLISERWPPICADSRARDFSNTNHSSNCPTESRPQIWAR